MQSQWTDNDAEEQMIRLEDSAPQTGRFLAVPADRRGLPAHVRILYHSLDSLRFRKSPVTSSQIPKRALLID